MRDPVNTIVEDMRMPSMAERQSVMASGRTADTHLHSMQDWPCLASVEVRQAVDVAESPAELVIAAWNIERCKHVEATAARLRDVSADVVLATEMDIGMARSGQRHTARDLADCLGFSYAFGVEFVELGLGDVRESRAVAGQSNRHGLHGNAILSRYPLEHVQLIPVAEEGGWFVDSPKGDDQLRIGGRMAVAARILTATGYLTLCSVHFESESDAGGRAAQSLELLTQLDRLYGQGQAVIGGDLNTRDIDTRKSTGAALLAEPQIVEPSFTAFARHGFNWQEANTGEVTTRPYPESPPDSPRRTLDWLFVRHAGAYAPRVAEAIGAGGEFLSDHELIAAHVVPLIPRNP